EGSSWEEYAGNLTPRNRLAACLSDGTPLARRSCCEILKFSASYCSVREYAVLDGKSKLRTKQCMFSLSTRRFALLSGRSAEQLPACVGEMHQRVGCGRTECLS